MSANRLQFSREVIRLAAIRRRAGRYRAERCASELTAHKLAASERHNNNDRHLFDCRLAQGGDGQDRRSQRLQHTLSASHRAPVLYRRIIATSQPPREPGGRTVCVRGGSSCGCMAFRPTGLMMRHCKTMEQPMLKRRHPRSVPRSGGLEPRRREHRRDTLRLGSSGRRMDEWCIVLLWRLKPSHPPSIV